MLLVVLSMAVVILFFVFLFVLFQQMKIQQFLEHHGLVSNPFADEDAQTDLVFKGACIRSVFHPAWDKIYGDPTEPATSVVFGEKGSGKTAMRLQIVRRLADYNADHPDHQVFVVQYDDFNPFIDRFREGFHGRRRRIDRALGQWRLWDHIDAILSLAVTQLVDRILEVQQARHPAARDEPLPIDKLDANQARDVALLAAIYDQSTAENPADRWQRLRKKLRFSTWKSKWDLAVGSGVTVAAVALFLYFGWSNLGALWPWMLARDRRRLAAVAGPLPEVHVEGLADRPQHAGAEPRHPPLAEDPLELPRRATGRPAAARRPADRSPLPAPGEVAVGAAVAAVGRHRGRSSIASTSRT